MTPLLRATRGGDMEQVEHLLSKGADVNQGSADNWTALMFAAWQGHEEAVVRLLDAGADPNRISKRIAKNTQGPIPKTTALAEATGNGHLSIARILMARGAAIDPISVALAARLEDLSLLKEMAAKGADLNQSANVFSVSTPLVMACSAGRLENVKWLVDNGAEAKGNRAALTVAAVKLHIEVAEYLLGLDRQGLFTETDKSSALFVVATKQDTRREDFGSQIRTLKLLLGHGANPHYRTPGPYEKGMTASELVRLKRKKYPRRSEGWVEHRTEIIDLLEKAEVEFGPEDPANRPLGLAKYIPLTTGQKSRGNASGGNWEVRFEQGHYLGFVVTQRSPEGGMTQEAYWGDKPAKEHRYSIQLVKNGSGGNALTLAPAGVTVEFPDTQVASRETVDSIDRRISKGASLLGRKFDLYKLESSGKPVFMLWVVFAQNIASADAELKEEFERYWSKQWR